MSNDLFNAPIKAIGSLPFVTNRTKPVHQTALPLLKRINEGRFTKSEVARRLNVLPQHVTNWLARGIPHSALPSVAEVCQISTDEYLIEAGLRKQRPSTAEETTMGKALHQSPLMERIERAFFWLTDEQKHQQIAVIEAMAETNKAISREIGRKVEPKPDAYVAQHLGLPPGRLASPSRKKH